MYLSTHQKRPPYSHISWLLQHLLEVSYVVALYHLRAERQGGQEGRIQQRFSIISPEEEAVSSCSP